MKIIRIFLERFLADEGTYPAAGIPSPGYFILIAATFFSIYTALNRTLTWSYEKIRSLIRWIISILCVLEILKIGWRFWRGYSLPGDMA